MFVDANEYKLNTPGVLQGFYSTDQTQPSWAVIWSQWIENGYVAFSPDGSFKKATIIYAPECVDCLLHTGATQIRPSFWPENH